MALAENGTLDRFGVELIGAKIPAIKKAEDRELFKAGHGAHRARACPARASRARSRRPGPWSATTGYPAIIRPSFTLGGTGGSVAYNPEELEGAVRWGLQHVARSAAC